MSFEPETIACIGRMKEKPLEVQVLRIDQLIKMQKQSGIWDKLDSVWFEGYTIKGPLMTMEIDGEKLT